MKTEILNQGGSGGVASDQDPWGAKGGTSESFCFCAVAWGTPGGGFGGSGCGPVRSRTGASGGSGARLYHRSGEAG